MRMFHMAFLISDLQSFSRFLKVSLPLQVIFAATKYSSLPFSVFVLPIVARMCNLFDWSLNVLLVFIYLLQLVFTVETSPKINYMLFFLLSSI